MRRRRLFWHLFPSYLLITLIALVAVTWYASESLRRFHLKRTVIDLEARAHLLEGQISEVLTSADVKRVDSLCKKLGAKASTRITVVLPSGTVIGDSEKDPASMENHADRPEIKEALAGRTGASTRYSQTLGEKMMYVAIPLEEHAKIVGVVRTSIPVTSIDGALRAIQIRIVLGGLVVAMLAAAVSLVVSRRISRPLEDVKRGAERLACGELGYRLPVPDVEEIGSLAEAINQMAAQCNDKMLSLVEERNRQEALLSSMAEGVLAVDAQGRVISLNRAAAELLSISFAEVERRKLQEIVGNKALQMFVTRALEGQEPIEGDIVLGDGGERFLHARGTLLRDTQGRQIGALVVLNDVTRLKRLEKVRSDFVANVSHELKTPITSIKGFVETLRDGAIRDPDASERFLGIVAKQADRLNAIIEDLLILSRIEQETERGEVILQECRIKDVLRSAIEVCGMKATAKNIRIDLRCEDDILAKANPHLLEQAIVNLIDNAIKYSEQGSGIQVEADRTDGQITISVRDQGCGIEKEHLPRIFERFYRVDKARSRKLGGTGLGLAIVKHIALAHGGNVSVDSAPGLGSTFKIHLPLPASANHEA